MRHEGYRRLVAAMPCIHCGAAGFSQAAHPNTQALGKGKSVKADDRLCFPLCVDRPNLVGCHTLFDQHKLYAKDQRIDVERAWVRKTILAVISAKQWPADLPLPDLQTWAPLAGPKQLAPIKRAAVKAPTIVVPKRDRTAVKPGYEINLTLPIRIESESNKREHWGARARRVKQHRQCAQWMLKRFDPPAGSVRVYLVRVAPRRLDAHDNLRAGFKATVDGICDWLGTKDHDPRLTFEYGQRSGGVGTYSVELTIEAD